MGLEDKVKFEAGSVAPKVCFLNAFEAPFLHHHKDFVIISIELLK